MVIRPMVGSPLSWCPDQKLYRRKSPVWDPISEDTLKIEDIDGGPTSDTPRSGNRTRCRAIQVGGLGDTLLFNRRLYLQNQFLPFSVRHTGGTGSYRDVIRN